MTRAYSIKINDPNTTTFGPLYDPDTNWNGASINFWTVTSLGKEGAQSPQSNIDEASTPGQLSVPVYLNLSAATYSALNSVVAIKGWTIMKDSSGQLLDRHIDASGMQAVAFQNIKTGAIVISYEGTNLGTPLSDFSFLLGQLGADIDIKSGITPQANVDALAFAKSVAQSAQGAPIYLTGHSLGGEEAEYVEANANVITGGVAGGAVFGAPGVPQQSEEAGNNFTVYLNYGDVLGGYVPTQGGHVGSVKYVGNSEDPITENQIVSNFIGDGTSAGAGLVKGDHSLQSGYASFFKVTLPTLSASPDSYGSADLAEFGYIVGVPLFGGVSAPQIQNGKLAVNGDLFSIGSGPSYLDLYDNQAVDVLTVVGEVANATSLGVVSIVNEGANSSISAGTESEVLIVNEGNGSSLIGGTGADTFIMESTGNTASSSTVTLTSNSRAVIESAKDTLTVAGESTVTCATDGKNAANFDLTFTSSPVVEIVSDVAGSAGQNTFTFGSSAGTLKIDQPTKFRDIISNFQTGDAIDLKGISATQATLGTSNVLAVKESNGSTISLQLSTAENFSGNAFGVVSDGQGGTDITVSNPNYTFSTLSLGVIEAPGVIGINASGEVAGVYLNQTNTGISFLDNASGSIVDFTPPLAPDFSGTGTYTLVPTAIDGFLALSDGGDVIGDYGLPNNEGGGSTEPFSFDGSSSKVIDPSGELYDTYYDGWRWVPASTTFAASVSATGEVVGGYADFTMNGSQVTSTFNGFIYANGVNTILTVPGSTDTEADVVNNSGEVAGTYDYQGSGPFLSESAFIYQGGNYTTFTTPTAGEAIDLRAINSAGTVVGFYIDGQNVYQTFVYQNGKVSVFSDVVDPATPIFINSAGVIAGSLYTGGEEQAFEDANGSATQIIIPGATSSSVTGLTDNGLVVGTFNDTRGSHGFVDMAGAVTVLNIPGATNTAVDGVNASGELVGTYENALGWHIFTATPTVANKTVHNLSGGFSGLSGQALGGASSDHVSISGNAGSATLSYEGNTLAALAARGIVGSNPEMAFIAGGDSPATVSQYGKEIVSRAGAEAPLSHPSPAASVLDLHRDFGASSLGLLGTSHFGAPEISGVLQAHFDFAAGSSMNWAAAERPAQMIGHSYGHALPL